jgi:hypothetical protein
MKIFTSKTLDICTIFLFPLSCNVVETLTMDGTPCLLLMNVSYFSYFVSAAYTSLKIGNRTKWV